MKLHGFEKDDGSFHAYIESHFFNCFVRLCDGEIMTMRRPLNLPKSKEYNEGFERGLFAGVYISASMASKCGGPEMLKELAEIVYGKYPKKPHEDSFIGDGI